MNTDQLAGMLFREIQAALDGGIEFFTLCVLERPQRYVQGVELNGDILLDVGADRFLGDDPLGDDGLMRLMARGWQAADEDHVNHWRMWPRHEAMKAAEELAATLRMVVIESDPIDPIVTHDGENYTSLAHGLSLA